MKFILIHSTGGDPDECWYPWLKAELERLGHEVLVPTFPTPEGQTLNNWMKAFKPYIEKIDEQTVFVGRSIGPVFILRILERIDVKVRACILVAGFVSDLKMPEFDEYVNSFIKEPYNWNQIKTNCKEFVVFHADNDPIVSLKHGEEMAEKLGVKPIIIPNAGHFNTGTDYFIKFPEILERIKEEFTHNV